MTVSWEFYKNRRRIDLESWKRSANIKSYKHFLRELRHLGVEPIQYEHPDVVSMNLPLDYIDENHHIVEEEILSPAERSDRDRAAEEKRLARFAVLDETSQEDDEKLDIDQEDSLNEESIDENKVEHVHKFTKTELNKMKKADVVLVLEDLEIHVKGKQTKRSLIDAILSAQENI
tara:strand:- start:19 stop:543 length:525 start_codon:yes stop_codon:yes gene_type:complete